MNQKKILDTYRYPASPFNLFFSLDNEHVIIQSYGYGQFEIWNTKTYQVLPSYDFFSELPNIPLYYASAISPDMQTIVIAVEEATGHDEAGVYTLGDNTALHLYKNGKEFLLNIPAESRIPRENFSSNDDAYRYVFSPNSEYLAVVASTGNILAWNIETQELVINAKSNTGDFTWLSIDSNGTFGAIEYTANFEGCVYNLMIAPNFYYPYAHTFR